MTNLSIPALRKRIRTEADAYLLLEELRWPNGPVCPHCHTDRAPYFLTPKAEEGRKTRTGKVTDRRVFKCAACRKQFSVLTGTIFHGTKIAVSTWIFVVVEMCASKNGVSAREIQRKYELTAKTAWFMTQRIREAMKRDPLAGLMAGTIIADETWIGGKPGNRHGGQRNGMQGQTDKTPVLSLIDQATGEVRSRVVPNVTGQTLRAAIHDQVHASASELHTDSSRSYTRVGGEFLDHEIVNHYDGEYVNERGAGTNMAESFFSQLKRSLDGTHHHVSVEHLPRYLAEFDFRHSTRRLSDAQRVARLMGQVHGRRLSYRPLTNG